MPPMAPTNDALTRLSAEELGVLFDRERLLAGREALVALAGDAQRERILRAMARSCAEHGYDRTTVGDVADSAGVPEALFYELFRDKEECFGAAMELAMAEAMGKVVEIHSPDKTWASGVREGVGAMLEFLAERPEFARILLVEAPAMGGRAYDLYASSKRLLQILVDRGRQDPMETRKIPASAGRSAVAAAESVTVTHILASDTEGLRDLLPELVYILMVPYVGQEEALREARTARETKPA